jgi:hypothetical protein
MNELICKLSEFESIKITVEENIDFNQIDFCCSEVQACFLNKQQHQLCIGQDTAGSFFTAFISNLKKNINNKLQLHESINQNLGFMENKYCHELPHQNPEFIMVPTSDNSSKYWVGANYKIWSTYNTTKPMLAAWLYNDHDGQIILEVTPLYKWSFFPDNLEDPEFITYEEFMKDYKPLIHRVITLKVAIAWLDQAMKVYRGFFSTEEDYIRACKENNW